MNVSEDFADLQRPRQGADIAIIGMACIFPGAPDLRTYWQNIVSKVDAVDDPPADWEAHLFYDPDSTSNDQVYCKRGGYIGDLLTFQPSDYGVMPKSIDGADPDHFVGLRIAGEALADAGYLDRPFARERCELIVGRGTYINRGFTNQIQHCYIADEVIRLLKKLHPEHTETDLKSIKDQLKENLPPFTADVAPGLVPNVMTGRIANRFDLMGTNYTVDAACASSLIALEHGVRDLQSGDCDMALVGGANVATTPPMLMLFCLLNALSRKQQIRPFSKTADGTLLGEGYGMVVLKRRQDAERDRDRIYAVIKGVGSGSDGRAVSVLAPRVEGEELAIRRAYDRAGLSPDTIGLIEAHGTATPVGDVAEIQALRRVFGTRGEGEAPRCALGTVKSMISHLIPAAGIAGLIKTALALYHRVLPPTLHCEDPNPELELEKTPFYLNTETRPWVHGGREPRRAGINAFGFGGINAHAILEEFVPHDETTLPSLHHGWDSEVVVLEGQTRQGLIEELDRLRRFLEPEPDVALKDVAATYNSKLGSADWRVAIVATSLTDLHEKAVSACERIENPGCKRIRNPVGIYFFQEQLGKMGPVAFLFPGEGSQYPNMFADLCIHFPEVRAWFDLMDRAFTGHHRGGVPSQGIFPPPAPDAEDKAQQQQTNQLYGMDRAVEAVFAANQALATLLGRLEIQPDVVLGHSTGEYSALLTAGAIHVENDEQLIRHILDLNRVYEEAFERGEVPEAVLLAVGATDRKRVESVVAESEGPLFVSMDNCPHQVVLCGTERATSRAAETLTKQGAVCQPLPFSRAYHTPLFETFCNPLRGFFASLNIEKPRITMYSCATAAPYPDDLDEINELALIQWARPVRFRDTIEAMYADGVRLFVEVGPRGNLSAFVEDTLRGRTSLAVPANLATHSGTTQLNHMVAQLAAQGVPMQLGHLYARRAPKQLDIDPAAEWAKDTGGKRGEMKLTGMLCGLRISEEAPLPSSRTPAEVAITSTAAAAAGTESSFTSTPGLRSQPVVAGTGLKPGPVLATAPAGLEASHAQMIADQIPAGNGRADAMQAYFHTMEQFLSSEEEIIQTFLRVSANRPTPAAINAAVAVPEDSPDESSPPRQQEAGGSFPLIGTVLALEAGKSLVARREINLDEDLFLWHHTIGSRTVAADPGLMALPVVPLTVSMEIMAEAAAMLFPDERLLGMKEVRGYRWVGLDKGLLTLQAVAARRAISHGIEVDVQVYEVVDATATEQPPPALVIEGIMLLGKKYGSPPDLEQAFPLEAEQPSRWHGEIRYQDGMFHGPAFQAVERVERTGKDGTEATLQVLPTDTLFRSEPAPQFVTDPVILDAAGQVVGYWALEHLQTGFNVFPFRLEALQLYGPNLPPSTRVTCRAHVTLVGETETRSDIDLFGPDGRLWMRLVGWWDRRFDMPLPFYRFRITPLEIVLSRLFPQGVAGLPAPENYRCFVLDSVPQSLLLTGWMIWARVLAHLVLTGSEREQWWSLDLADTQRIEWLLERTVAKDAVRVLLQEKYDVTVYPADIEIVTGINRQPIVKGHWTAKIPAVPTLSLTHSSGIAAAIAGVDQEIASVGIDLEHLDRFRDGFDLDHLIPSERALLDSLAPEQQLEWSVRLRCAKESLRKALSGGAVGGPQALSVRDFDAVNGQVRIGIAGEMAAAFRDRADTVFTASTRRDGNLIIAIASV